MTETSTKETLEVPPAPILGPGVQIKKPTRRGRFAQLVKEVHGTSLWWRSEGGRMGTNVVHKKPPVYR